jgi:hypothetical protein
LRRRRIVLHASVVEQYDVAIEKVVDDNGNALDFLVVVDGEIIAMHVKMLPADGRCGARVESKGR